MTKKILLFSMLLALGFATSCKEDMPQPTPEPTPAATRDARDARTPNESYEPYASGIARRAHPLGA